MYLPDSEIALRVPYEQMYPNQDFWQAIFRSKEWQSVYSDLKSLGVGKVLPTSENGGRRLSSDVFAQHAGLINARVDGGDREMSFEEYIWLRGKNVDPVDYQSQVVASKHNRVRRFSQSELREFGLEENENNRHEIMTVGFDTIIWSWDRRSMRFVPTEKPKSDEQTLNTILALSSGAPFIVSTVCRVDNFHQHTVNGVAATFLPCRLKVPGDRKADFVDRVYNTYLEIKAGDARPWKVAPPGPSLLHPVYAEYLEVAVDPTLHENVLPADFASSGFKVMPGQTRDLDSHMLKGDQGYQLYVEALIKEYGFTPVNDLEFPLSHKVSLIPSGVSEVGMREAIKRYMTMAKIDRPWYDNGALLHPLVRAMTEGSNVGD